MVFFLSAQVRGGPRTAGAGAPEVRRDDGNLGHANDPVGLLPVSHHAMLERRLFPT